MRQSGNNTQSKQGEKGLGFVFNQNWKTEK